MKVEELIELIKTKASTVLGVVDENTSVILTIKNVDRGILEQAAAQLMLRVFEPSEFGNTFSFTYKAANNVFVNVHTKQYKTTTKCVEAD